MKQCAVVLNGTNDVIKITDLKKKFYKIQSNPNMKVLEECSLDKLEEKFDYWNRIINRDKELEKESIKKYYFKNSRYTIVSIYPTLDNLKGLIEDIDDYIMIDDYEEMV